MLANFAVGILKQRTLSSVLVSFVLACILLNMPATAADKVELAMDVSKPGAKIDRNLFGQFAEHLGHGIYEGIWVGRDSKIPNTHGIRNDVVTALKAIKVPNVRWPGGCIEQPCQSLSRALCRFYVES